MPVPSIYTNRAAAANTAFRIIATRLNELQRQHTAAHIAAQEADDAFQRGVERETPRGLRAGDFRYQSSRHSARLRQLATVKQQADATYLAISNAMWDAKRDYYNAEHAAMDAASAVNALAYRASLSA